MKSALSLLLLSLAAGTSRHQRAFAFCPPPSATTAAPGTTKAAGAGSTSTSTSTGLSMALTLYGSQGSRSPLVNWGAAEVGLPVSMARNLSDNPHPFGQIPCLADSGSGETVVVFESGAILQHLYGKAESTDGDSDRRAAAVTSWISWANASLDPICFIETPDGKVYDTGLKKPNKRIDVLEKLLGEQDFLVEGGFSLADVAVASYLLYVPQFFQGVSLSRWPNVVSYMKRCAEREAYGAAFGPQVQAYLVAACEGMLLEAGSGGGDKKKLFGMF
ncbi:unnamed protein product [Pseudo-nitzschia multistriata]|uniref:GST C-terminal domain-containing protein n=1 Tax=Pseudo-nitzschia multistriata TaxID=183589 RepID=A0A448YUD5_9STRA|nr:unnamed protein product [Pseudo-nitzschia multistriata]